MNTQDKLPRLVISIPCYNEEAVLEYTASKLCSFIENMVDNNIVAGNSFILFSNNGSTDRTWELIQTLHNSTKYVNGICLASNVGFQNNLFAGMMVAKDYADIVVTLDADLQDDYTVIPEMVNKWKYEDCDVVLGVRNNRSSDSWLKRNSAGFFYKVMNWMGAETVQNHADFRLMSKRFIEELSKYRERNLFIRGIVSKIGYKSGIVYYSRKKRIMGNTKFNFMGLVNLALDGITDVSVKPVRMLFSVGMLFSCLSLLILTYVSYQKLFYQVPLGWASIVLSIWFCTGMLLMGMGVLGEYIGKIYVEVKDRPRFNVIEKLFYE